MRKNMACWALAVSTLVALSGCSSGSGSSWAFWRTSPFSSTQGATPSGVGAPEKPAGIAAGNTATPPSGTYSATNPPASPPFGQPGAQGGYNPPNTGYNTPNSYPNTQYPSTAAGATPATPSGYSGYGGTPYTASTAGVPGANAYGTPPASSAGGRGYDTGASSGGYPPTGSTAPSSYAPRNYPPSGSGYSPSNYPPSGASGNDLPPNPVRSDPSYPSTDSSRYGGGTTGSSTGATGYSGGANRYDATAGGTYNPTATGSYDRAGGRAERRLSLQRHLAQRFWSVGDQFDVGRRLSAVYGRILAFHRLSVVRQQLHAVGGKSLRLTRCHPALDRRQRLHAVRFRLHAGKYGRKRIRLSHCERNQPFGVGREPLFAFEHRHIGAASLSARQHQRISPGRLGNGIDHTEHEFRRHSGQLCAAVGRHFSVERQHLCAIERQQLSAIERQQLLTVR